MKTETKTRLRGDQCDWPRIFKSQAYATLQVSKDRTSEAREAREELEASTHYNAVLKKFFNLKYTEAIRLDPDKVVDMSKEELTKEALRIFNKYADSQGGGGNGNKPKLSLKALTSLMHKELNLKKKFGSRFSDLVNTTFIWLDIHNQSAIGFAEFRTRARHLLFLKKCPTSKHNKIKQFYR